MTDRPIVLSSFGVFTVTTFCFQVLSLWCSALLPTTTTSLVGATTTTDVLGCTTNPNESYTSLSNIAERPPAYTEWLSRFGTTNYDHTKYFGTTDNIALHWNITNNARLYVAVAVLMSDTTSSSSNNKGGGWVGFGISDAGGMAGADMALFTVSSRETTTTTNLVDAYCEDYTTPIVDKCQDWKLHQSFVCENENILVFEASRKLHTGDPQDYTITYDGDSSFSATKVIFAHGNTDTVSYHSPNHVAKGVVRFFGDEDPILRVDKSSTQERQDEDYWNSMEMTAGNIPVPRNETTYAKFCFASTDFLEENSSEVHAVAMQYISDERSRGFVHHLILYGSYEEDDCDGAPSPFYVWTPGSEDFVLPADVGVSIGGKHGFKSFRLKVHYSNPNGVPGIIDNTGVRLLYTTKMRQFNAGMLGLGDPGLTLDGEPLGKGVTKWTFECPASCMKRHLGGTKKKNKKKKNKKNTSTTAITVFAQILHMHAAGKRMSASQIRGGKVIKEAYTDYYDYRAAGSVPVRQPVVPYDILPGDSFRISCYYEDLDNSVIFGRSFRDEMCISFVWYYPEIQSFIGTCGANNDFDPDCDGPYSVTSLVDTNEMGRIFGSELDTCLDKTKNDEESGTF